MRIKGLLVSLAVCASIGLSPLGVAALPTPIPQASQTPPPDVAAPSPTPLPLLVNGQVIDVELGFIVFTSGDALRLAPNALLLDDATGTPLHGPPAPGSYAIATLDVAGAMVTSVRFSHKAFRSRRSHASTSCRRPRRSPIPSSSLPNRSTIVS
jgi:hypothetical protein